MRDLKDMLKGAVDKIKSTVEKADIPLSEAYAQMDKDIEEAEAAYGKHYFPLFGVLVPYGVKNRRSHAVRGMPFDTVATEVITYGLVRRRIRHNGQNIRAIYHFVIYHLAICRHMARAVRSGRHADDGS